LIKPYCFRNLPHYNYHADWTPVEKDVDYPFVLADNPLEIKSTRTYVQRRHYIQFKDKDGSILGGVFLTDVTGKVPTLYWVIDCMDTTKVITPEGTVPTQPETIIVISKVKGGLTVECNGVILVHFKVEDSSDRAKCEVFIEGDVQRISFWKNGDQSSEFYRQSGK
jgi:hypothetical protein